MRLRHALLAATFLAAPAAGAQTIVTDPGALHLASGFANTAGTGSAVGGLRVTAYFSDATSQTGAWGDLGGGAWGVSQTGFRLSLGANDDTWVFADGPGAWQLQNLSTHLGLTRLVLQGAPGSVVFDLGTDPDTPGSFAGVSFFIVNPAGDPFATTATYRNIVQVIGEPIGVDVYETIDASFGTALAAGQQLRFVADADILATAPMLAPEPATVALLGGGLLGVAGVARRRRS